MSAPPVVEHHARACRSFAALVASIGRDQWDRPTPCADWDVRSLVTHVVGEDLWTVPLLAGRTIAEVGDRFDGDLLGTDPPAAAATASDAARRAIDEPGVLLRTVALSFGETPADEYVWQLFADHLIHGWDLAVAIGADPHLDADLVAACAAWFDGREEAYRAAGAIGPRPDQVPDDPQSALLAAFGRTA